MLPTRSGVPHFCLIRDEVIGRGIAAELHGGRDLPVGARWLKQQDESIGVMKIRFVGRMVNRPVREPIACLDDRREPETKGCMRVDSRQDIEPDQRVQLEPTASRSHGDVWAHPFVRERPAVAIAAEGVRGPFPRRGKVELVVRRLPFQRDEGFEAGMSPELCSDARHAGQRDLDPGNISVEAEGHLEFSACRSAYDHLNAAHRISARRRMAPEVDTVFDGHDGLDAQRDGSPIGISVKPCALKSLSRSMFLLSQLSAIHHYIAEVTISLTSLYVARAGPIVSLREMTWWRR